MQLAPFGILQGPSESSASTDWSLLIRSSSLPFPVKWRQGTLLHNDLLQLPIGIIFVFLEEKSSMGKKCLTFFALMTCPLLTWKKKWLFFFSKYPTLALKCS